MLRAGDGAFRSDQEATVALQQLFEDEAEQLPSREHVCQSCLPCYCGGREVVSISGVIFDYALSHPQHSHEKATFWVFIQSTSKAAPESCARDRSSRVSF